MDKKAATHDKTLLEAALTAARAHGLELAIEPGAGQADPVVRLHHAGHEAVYAVALRRGLCASTLGAALHHIDGLGRPALLVTEHAAPALADELKARGVAFLDSAGNAYFNRPPLLVWVKGQKLQAKPTAPLTGRAFQPTGLQVLFALLCKPQAVNRPYRELAAMAGVAHGTVGWVIPDLQRQGFVRDLNGQRGTRRLYEAGRLLNQWSDAYARLLRPRTLIGRYYVPTLEGWRDWPLAEHGAQWGGEPAAAVLTDYLRPGELTLYAEKLPGVLAARQKFMKEPAPGHTAVVEVRRRFWNFAGEPGHDDLVPPVLVYADLLATGDARCIETAKLVHGNHVVRLFAEG